MFGFCFKLQGSAILRNANRDARRRQRWLLLLINLPGTRSPHRSRITFWRTLTEEIKREEIRLDVVVEWRRTA